ncbi:MAG: TonB-dependent receptor, partial [Phenylobacterium sp.]|nr:TonB-dependent receptor [Phenylobacterium sp.]
VYQPFIVAADLQLNNIERIEVLKGPQGALFGRNATGGAINIITKQPHAGFDGQASVSYGRFNEWIGKLYAAGGTDRLAADIAVMANRDDGYIHDIVKNRRYGAMHDVSVRSQLRLRPSDGIDFTLALGHTENVDNTASANQPLNGDTSARKFNPGVLTPSTPYEVALNLSPVNKTLQNSASLVGTIHLDALDLHTITGVQFNKLKALADSDATVQRSVELYVAQSSRTIYQEVYATSNGQGPLSWIVGGVFYHDWASAGPQVGLSGTFVQTAVSGAGSFTSNDTNLETSSWAGYAQATYKITDALSVTVGGRYTSDKRTFFNQNIAPTPGPILTGSATFSKFTPSGSIAYRVNERLNLYAKAGQAFKSGLFTLVGTVVRPVQPETVTQYEIGVKSDPLDWLRVNASAYYTDYKGLQTTARDPVTSVAFLQNAAAASIYGLELETVVRPVERLNLTGGVSLLHAEYTSFPNAQVTVPTAATACAARGAPFPCGNDTVFRDVSGYKLIRTPFFTVNLGGDYTIPLSQGDLVVSGNFYYSGHSYWDPLNRLKEPSYVLVNGQLRWNAPDDHTSLSVWGDNLLDQKYNLTLVTSSSDTHVYARPRTYGVRVDYRW